MTRRYPTRYVSDARLKIDLVNDHLAGKEMEIGRFYERGQVVAATIVSATWSIPTRPRRARGADRLVEAYLLAGFEAQKAAAVLGLNYPGSVL